MVCGTASSFSPSVPSSVKRFESFARRYLQESDFARGVFLSGVNKITSVTFRYSAGELTSRTSSGLTGEGRMGDKITRPAKSAELQRAKFLQQALHRRTPALSLPEDAITVTSAGTVSFLSDSP